MERLLGRAISAWYKARPRRFEYGPITVTAGISDLIREGRMSLEVYQACFARHMSCDWGEVDDHDWKLNDAAARAQQGRIISSYLVGPDTPVWIITSFAGPGTYTTMLLPEEY